MHSEECDLVFGIELSVIIIRLRCRIKKQFKFKFTQSYLKFGKSRKCFFCSNRYKNCHSDVWKIYQAD